MRCLRLLLVAAVLGWLTLAAVRARAEIIVPARLLLADLPDPTGWTCWESFGFLLCRAPDRRLPMWAPPCDQAPGTPWIEMCIPPFVEVAWKPA